MVAAISTNVWCQKLEYNTLEGSLVSFESWYIIPWSLFFGTGSQKIWDQTGRLCLLIGRKFPTRPYKVRVSVEVTDADIPRTPRKTSLGVFFSPLEAILCNILISNYLLMQLLRFGP